MILFLLLSPFYTFILVVYDIWYKNEDHVLNGHDTQYTIPNKNLQMCYNLSIQTSNHLNAFGCHIL